MQKEIKDPIFQHKHGDKVLITKQSIEKIKYVRIDGIEEELCKTIHQMNKELLLYAMEHNNSSEVGCIFDLTNREISKIVKGDENSLELRKDTSINHIFLANTPSSLIVSHNHPGLSYFSRNDLEEFIAVKAIKTMFVIKNNGTLCFINKTSKFDGRKAFFIYDTIIKKDIKSDNKIVHEFLKLSNKIGIQKG